MPELHLAEMTPMELGESGLVDSIPFLIDYLHTGSTSEIRLAASAIRKLANKHLAACKSAKAALFYAVSNNEGQPRQYALNALRDLKVEITDDQKRLLETISNTDEKEYNRNAARVALNSSTGEVGAVKEVESSNGDHHFDSSESAQSSGSYQPNRIKLTGEQKRVLALPLNNPLQIKGVAGSGKTTIAIFRAKHLIASAGDLFRDTHVCIFSYTKSLIKYVRSILDTDTGSTTSITVTHFHKWAYAFLKERGFWSSHNVAGNSSIESMISVGLAELRPDHRDRAILNKPLEFYKEEFAWLKGRRIVKFTEYLDAKRTGRGTSDRVTIKDKELLWKLYTIYCNSLREKKEVDFDDFALWVLAYIEKGPAYVPPYSHIVVDEAQDLTPAQLLCITKLVNPETNSITIIADAAQRIYKSGFAWSDVGINVRGARTVEFKHNYRNTLQIAQAATSLLSHDPQQSDFSEQILPERQGPKPMVLRMQNEQQVSFLSKACKEIDLSLQSVVVLHRNRWGVTHLTNALRAAGFSPFNVTSQDVQRIQSVGLFTSTMSSVKGLEFDHVYLCDMNDNLIPYPPGFTDDNDELHISTERRLVYTCMTRARHTLHLISTGQPSRYLAEIDSTTVEAA